MLVSGASALLTLLLPKTYEAMGPAAMASMFVLLGSIGAVPLGLIIRLVVSPLSSATVETVAFAR